VQSKALRTHSFYNRLVEDLGRELQRDEAAPVQQIQTFYANTSVCPPVESGLRLITGADNAYSYWQELKLWPVRSRDVVYCWLYIARELCRRKVGYPQFMDGITDLNLIEADLAEWEREKQIAHWKDWFRNFDQPEPVSDVGTLELLLVLARLGGFDPRENYFYCASG